MKCASLLVACLLLLSSVCHAQGYMNVLEGQVNTGNTGKLPWTIKKENLNNASKVGEKFIGDFPTKDAAQKEADKLNKALKGNDYYDWNYKPWERGTGGDNSVFDPGSPGTGANPKASPIKPKLSIVDPGGSANSSGQKSPKSWLLGKRGKGKYTSGNYDATIEISQAGRVTINSLFGEHTPELRETPDGRAFFDTVSSIYDVTIKGSELTVTRRFKKGFGGITGAGTETWTFMLDGAPFEAPMEKGQAYNPPKDLGKAGSGTATPKPPSNEYFVVTSGQFDYLNNSTSYGADKASALQRAKEGWDVWKKRSDMYGVKVIDSSGNVLVEYKK